MPLDAAAESPRWLRHLWWWSRRYLLSRCLLRAFHIDVVARTEHHVVVGTDTCLRIGGYAVCHCRWRAVPLRWRWFLSCPPIGNGVAGAVGQIIGCAVGNHDIRAFPLWLLMAAPVGLVMETPLSLISNFLSLDWTLKEPLRCSRSTRKATFWQ